MYGPFFQHLNKNNGSNTSRRLARRKRSEDNRMEVSEAGLVISYRYCSNTWASHNLSNFSSSYTMSATIKHIWKYLTDLLKGTYLSNFLFSHIGLYELIKNPGCWVSLKTINLWFFYTADKIIFVLFSLCGGFTFCGSPTLLFKLSFNSFPFVWWIDSLWFSLPQHLSDWIYNLSSGWISILWCWTEQCITMWPNISVNIINLTHNYFFG